MTYSASRNSRDSRAARCDHPSWWVKHEKAIGLSVAHTVALSQRLDGEGLTALIDKRQGQQSDYRITPEVKAELVQQFAVDIIARGKTSGEAISEELRDRCLITVPARTVRHHLARLELGQIKQSLPKLVAKAKGPPQQLPEHERQTAEITDRTSETQY